MAEQDRKRLFLPFGDGLERAKGVMVTEPTQFEDLRNMILWDGKAEFRKGYSRTCVLIDDASADLETVLALSPIRAEGAAIGIGYESVNNRVHANLMGIDGTGPSHIDSGLGNDQVFDLSATATFDPPIIHLADTYNKCFIAHDEPAIAARAQTAYYDPNASPQIQYMTADLDSLGDNPVYFRGVTRFLSYLCGWGFGSDSEPDRPDIVRVSLAGDPLLYDPRHYFIAGQRSEPVMTCKPAGKLLQVFKETETYEIFGYSPETFGIRPADTRYGCVGSRLAVSLAGTVFYWSTQGPRVTAGGESVDLAMPLDIGGPDPATLVAESDPEEAFADYDAVNRVITFVWGRRVYALSLRSPERRRWSYYELGANAEPLCSAQFFVTQATGGGGTAPTGWPRVGGAATGPAAPVMGDTTMDLEWYNNLANGTEVVEIWIKDVDGTGTWSKVAQPAVDLSGGGPNYVQTYQVTGLQALHEYEVACRYKAAGQFSPGHTGTSPYDPPDQWTDPACPGPPECPPAYVSGLYCTATAPTIVTRSGDNHGLWSREGASAEQIIVDIVIPAGHENLTMTIERERSTWGNTATQNINGMGPPDTSDQTTEARLVVDSAHTAGDSEYVDTAVTGEQWHEYWVKFNSPGAAPDSAYSSPVKHWAGPDAPLSGSQILNCDPTLVWINSTWQNAVTPVDARTCPSVPPAAHSTELWWKNVTQASVWFLGSTKSPYQTNATWAGTPPTPGTGDDIRVAVRHKTTCSGVDDYSGWMLPGYDGDQIGPGI
ncbi:MAG: hypothetical protein M8858_08145 [marine benthic group bacterium]|nr:hypothetical protein [Gemmatimonadota bacterium]